MPSSQKGTTKVLARYAVAPDTLKHLIVSGRDTPTLGERHEPGAQHTVSVTGRAPLELVHRLHEVFGHDIVAEFDTSPNSATYTVNCLEFPPHVGSCAWRILPQQNFEVIERADQNPPAARQARWWQSPAYPPDEIAQVLADYLAYGEAFRSRYALLRTTLPSSLADAARLFLGEFNEAHWRAGGIGRQKLDELARTLSRLLLIYGNRLTGIACGSLRYNLANISHINPLSEAGILAFVLAAHAAITSRQTAEAAVASAATFLPYAPSILAAYGILAGKSAESPQRQDLANLSEHLADNLDEEETHHLDCAPSELNEPALASSNGIEIVSAEDYNKAVAKSAAQAGEAERRHRAILHRFAETGFRRQLAPAPEPAALNALCARFPNFSHVLEHIERHLTLNRVSSPNALVFRPILLHGSPGIGKTRFASALAASLGTYFGDIAMSTVTASFVLSGGDLMWNGGRPGRIHEIMTASPFANPIILLDEIDKTSGDQRFDPTTPLLQLLERHSARRFLDEAFGLPMDASRILWLATANHVSALAPALLDRFDAIEIANPTLAELHAIAQSIYADMLDQHPWGEHFCRPLCAESVRELNNLSARAIKKRLEDAASRAISARPESRPAQILPHDIRAARRAETPGFGFIP